MGREAWARWRVFRAAVRRLRLPLLALGGVVTAGTLALWLEGGEPDLGHSLLYVLNLITFQAGSPFLGRPVGQVERAAGSTFLCHEGDPPQFCLDRAATIQPGNRFTVVGSLEALRKLGA